MDKTELNGNYDLELKWAPNLDSPVTMQVPPPGIESASPDTSDLSILTAIQEQLGLKLNATHDPAEGSQLTSATPFHL